MTVKKLTKTVPVTVKMTGKMNDKLSNISYSLSQNQVTITGSQDALNAVNEVVANVDVSNMTKDTNLSVNLTADNVAVEPSIVTVQLTVTKK